MQSLPKIGVLASGGGSNLQALLDARARGDLAAPIVLVISNNRDAYALERARANGIAARHISSKTCDDVDAELTAALKLAGVDLVVLAGYMKQIGPRLLAAFPNAVVNIHPGPLPAFGGQGMFGKHVHAAVLAAGATHSGPTVHLVDADYDHGPHLAHVPVEVVPDDTADTLAARVLAAEHDLLWRVIQRHWVEGLALPSHDS